MLVVAGFILAKSSGDHSNYSADFLFYSEALIVMSTDTRALSSACEHLERRSERRYTINQGAVVFFAGHAGVYSCCIRDLTSVGTGIRLNSLAILPSEFGISFDNFRATRRCRLIWRDGDFVGATFDPQQNPSNS